MSLKLELSLRPILIPSHYSILCMKKNSSKFIGIFRGIGRQMFVDSFFPGGEYHDLAESGNIVEHSDDDIITSAETCTLLH